MAIAFRAVGTTSKVASGNMSPGLPAGHVLNDILILFTNQADTVSCSVSGWTNISALTASFGAGNLNHQEVWAIRDNGSVSAPTVTHASGSVSNAIIAAFSGVDSGLTVGAAGAGSIFRDAQKQTGTNATTFTAPALTGVVSGDMRIFLGQFSVADTSGATTNNWGTVSGFTEDIDDCSSLGGANAASFGIDHLLASGSAGSITSAVGWVGSTTSTTPQFWAWQCSQLALSSDSAGGVTVISNLLRPTVVGPTSRAFHMLQRIPTLPVVAPAPFALMDWPNMWAKPNPVETRTIADASEFWMLQDTFFGVAGEAPANLNWPVPKGRPYPLSTWVISVDQSARRDTFFGAAGQPPANLDWPNPMRAIVPNIDLRSWLQSLKQNLLGKDTFFAGPGVGPDYDYPNPRAAKRNPQDHIKPTELKLIGQDQFFADAGRGPSYDWPNPQTPRPASDLRTHIWNPLLTLLTVIVQAPFAFFDWIVPLGQTPNPSLKTHIDPLKTNLQGQDQFFGPAGLGPLYDWPNPQIPTQPITNRTWHLPNWITTLGSIIPAVVSGAEIILLLPMGKLAKRITSKIYEVLD